MDADDLELFERSLRNATASHTGAALDDALDALGWSDAMEDDPRAAVSILFSLQGGAGATSSAVDLVVARALGSAHEPASGIVLPAIGSWAPPGTVAGDTVVVDGLATAALAGRDAATVVATAGVDTIACTVPTASLQLDLIEGIDPAFGLRRVTGTVTLIGTEPSAETATTTDETDEPGVAERWTAGVDQARLALGHELVGVSRTMLRMAREHALERVQFGQPISSFQAIRHRLAETLVAIEAADAVLDAAWLDGTSATAAMAKAMAGRGARTTVRHCQQVLAGIGFTTEHDLHLFIRRTLVLDGLLGTATALTRTLGDDLVATRQLPPLLPL